LSIPSPATATTASTMENETTASITTTPINSSFSDKIPDQDSINDAIESQLMINHRPDKLLKQIKITEQILSQMFFLQFKYYFIQS
jgi:hypothetical protein